MRRLALMLLATTSLVAVTQSAPAADLRPSPIRKAPAAVIPSYYSWTGCYVGGHVGWGWGRKDVAPGVVDLGPPFGDFDFAGFRTDVDGFLGGVQAGCNYQLNPSWVIGVEGQFSWMDIKGDTFRDPFLLGKAAATNEARFSAQVDWIATLAARIGYTWDRWMLYGKGGVAWARDKYSLVGGFDPDQQGVRPFSFGAKETRVGWMVGVGLEYAFLSNWSAKAEYNFMDFGRDRITFTGLVDGAPATAIADIDQQFHVVKFGVNYRWSLGPRAVPVAARY
jgi:outer membrane immunogenic protein